VLWRADGGAFIVGAMKRKPSISKKRIISVPRRAGLALRRTIARMRMVFGVLPRSRRIRAANDPKA